MMNRIAFTSPLYCGILALFLFSSNAIHGRDIMAQRISVSFSQTPIESALSQIAMLGHFQWSYNAGILEDGLKVNYSANQTAIREILHEILGPNYHIKQNGDYLILKKLKDTQRNVSGYLSDKKTGRRISNATIYDPNSMRSTLTDQDGYYQMTLGKASTLVVAALDYRDTAVQVRSNTPHFIKIEIVRDSFIFSRQFAHEKKPRFVANLFKIYRQQYNTLNTQTDSLRRAVQVSFIPNIGTNHLMSGSVSNVFSLNILAGYSRGVTGLEIGGVGNVIRQNVEGLQAGGVINRVGGYVEGMQVGGAVNSVGGYVEGMQVGGALNWVGGHFEGMQVGGVCNNVNGYVEGLQVGGVFNRSGGYFEGMQIGGVANLTHKRMSGFQVAGISNIGDTMSGIQISGLFNSARKMNGLQIGLVNVAQSMDGAQIGLVNIVREGGYIALEGGYNEVFPANISFRSGTPRFYTILTASYAPKMTETNENLWSTGVGLGTWFGAAYILGGAFELTQRHINLGGYSGDVQEWSQALLRLNIRLGKHVILSAGPSVNMLFCDDTAIKDAVLPQNLPMPKWVNREDLNFWIGGSGGIQYRF